METLCYTMLHVIPSLVFSLWSRAVPSPMLFPILAAHAPWKISHHICYVCYAWLSMKYLLHQATSLKSVLEKQQLLLQDGRISHLRLLLPHPILLANAANCVNSASELCLTVSLSLCLTVHFSTSDIAWLVTADLHSLQLFHHSTTLLFSALERRKSSRSIPRGTSKEIKNKKWIAEDMLNKRIAVARICL